jgi:hypothetical protein
LGALERNLGRGDIISPGGVSRKVQPKENGIGSKNFVLRSLFLFSDRIYLCSAGKMAVLDLKTLGNQLVPDQLSRGRPGVSIDVPYRTDQFGKLEPFTLEREQAALDQMATEIPHTLVKLVVASQKRSLNQLAISAERLKRRISWRQEAQTVRCRTKGVTGLRRDVRLRHLLGEVAKTQPWATELMAETTQIATWLRTDFFG